LRVILERRLTSLARGRYTPSYSQKGNSDAGSGYRNCSNLYIERILQMLMLTTQLRCGGNFFSAAGTGANDGR